MAWTSVATIGSGRHRALVFRRSPRTRGTSSSDRQGCHSRTRIGTDSAARIPKLDLRGAYSYLHSVSVADGVTRPLQTRPRHRGSLEWVWTPMSASAVRGAVYQTGSQLFDSRGAIPVQMRADSYTLVDLGFTQRLTRRFDLAFDVTNLFDRLYDQAYGLPREGRAALLTLRARAT